ncbi:MAG: hypothetical protein HKP57_08090 [Halobacteria archaeon]|nr:hypothetical protein [Halobacteria archaeon]
MHELKQHDEVATGIHEFPAGLQSFLETSARHFGLDGVRPALRCRHAGTQPGEGPELKENQYLEKRGVA